MIGSTSAVLAVFNDSTSDEARTVPYPSTPPQVTKAIIQPDPDPADHAPVLLVSSSSCGSVQSLRLVSNRIFAHSKTDGRCRFSGLASQSADRSASRSSARPRRVSLCLRVSQSRREWTRKIVCELVVLPTRHRVADFRPEPSGSVGVIRQVRRRGCGSGRRSP